MNPWTGLIGEAPKLASPKMRITTHCPDCNHPHKLERPIPRGEKVYLLCHGCETVFYTECPL